MGHWSCATNIISEEDRERGAVAKRQAWSFAPVRDQGDLDQLRPRLPRPPAKRNILSVACATTTTNASLKSGTTGRRRDHKSRTSCRSAPNRLGAKRCGAKRSHRNLGTCRFPIARRPHLSWTRSGLCGEDVREIIIVALLQNRRTATSEARTTRPSSTKKKKKGKVDENRQ